MTESQFISDLRDVLNKHNATLPKFAYGAGEFDGKILYGGPCFDESELLAAIDTLVNGKWAVNGEKVYQFEREFSKYVGQAESVMVNSGSSANLLMIAAARKRYGWKDNDSIIVSPVGFPTTVSAITLNGLNPFFVDIEFDTLNFDLKQIEDILEFQLAINVQAIFVSPVLGNPPDMDKLTALAEKYGVRLILDGCDSLGSKWNDKHLSDYAVATSCSFYPAHHITTLQGGTISSNDLELIQIARSMSAWGRDCWCKGSAALLQNGVCGRRFSNWLPEVDCTVDHKYVYTNVGYNLQPLDIQAAIGLEQLKKIEWIHTLRSRAHIQLVMELESKTKVVCPKSLKHATPSWFGVPIVCPNKEYKQKLVAHLENNKIQTRNYFAGNILLHPAYSALARSSDFPNANRVLDLVFFIGNAPFYTQDHLDYIKSVIRSFKE